MPTTSIREARQQIAIRRLETFLRRSHKELRVDIASAKLATPDDLTVQLACLRDLAISRGYTTRDLAAFDV